MPGEYYKVRGLIRSVDKTAPPIEFQVNLPKKWNHKMVQFGGGGFNGTLVTADGLAKGQGKEDIPPLAQGYVTYGSDGGHKATPWDASWSLNDEALNNFAGEQIKKTKDVVAYLVKTYYGKAAKKSYFIGGSNGGREGLVAAQRYPKDYDGVVALYPVISWVPKALKDHENTMAILANTGDGWISSADYEKIKRVVLKECDGLDGKVDGLIADPLAADKMVEKINQALAKELTPRQIAVWNAFLTNKIFVKPLPDNITDMQGYSVSQLLNDWICNQLGTAKGKRDGTMMFFGDDVIRYQIVRNKTFDVDSFQLAQWEKEVEKASKLLDATNLDLSAFRNRGGKLIFLHGTSDQLVPIKENIKYYKKLQQNYGAKELETFVRFYVVPGYGHGNGSVFTMGRDLLADMDAWVVQNKAPSALTVVDQNKATYGRKQVLQPYK